MEQFLPDNNKIFCGISKGVTNELEYELRLFLLGRI